jgi:hypothetical protein
MNGYSQVTNFMGGYMVTEIQTGITGEAYGYKDTVSYNIHIVKDSVDGGIVILNLAQLDSVKATVNADSIIIPKQIFDNLHGTIVIIQGKGKLIGDTIKYYYGANGSTGGVACEGIAVRTTSGLTSIKKGNIKIANTNGMLSIESKAQAINSVKLITTGGNTLYEDTAVRGNIYNKQINYTGILLCIIKLENGDAITEKIFVQK